MVVLVNEVELVVILVLMELLPMVEQVLEHGVVVLWLVLVMVMPLLQVLVVLVILAQVVPVVCTEMMVDRLPEMEHLTAT